MSEKWIPPAFAKFQPPEPRPMHVMHKFDILCAMENALHRILDWYFVEAVVEHLRGNDRLCEQNNWCKDALGKLASIPKDANSNGRIEAETDWEWRNGNLWFGTKPDESGRSIKVLVNPIQWQTEVCWPDGK